MTGMERNDARRFLPSWRPVARLLTAFALMVTVLGAVPGAANAQTATIFADDFESNLGWQTNPAGTDTATTGQWERANPQSTSFNGTKQRGDVTSGSNALVTGASAGSSVGTNDIDNGVTSMRSPVISLANFADIQLSFDYYMAHLDNSSSSDFFRVSIVGDSSQVVFSEQGNSNDDDANWQRTNVSLNAFAGQSVRILVEAADASSPSLVEAALDTLVITGTPVQVNTPPVVTAPADQTSTEGDSVTLAVIGTDADEDSLTWSATGLPADLSIDSATGVISGTVADGAASETPYAVVVSASDGTDTASANFSWTVEEPAPNQSPVVTNPVDQVSVEGDTVSLQLEATDPDGDPLQYFIEVLPPSLSLDRDTGIISGTFTEGSADGSPWGIFVAVTDGISDASLIGFQWTVNPLVGNTAPVVTSPGDQASDEGDVVTLAVVGTDADEDVLTWSATGLPADLSIDAATGVISGTVAEGAEDGSPYAVAVAADDGTDTTTVNFNWTVGAVVGNQPPVPVNPGNQISVEGEAISLQVVATDADEDSLSYFAESLPADLSIDNSTGLISGTITAGAADGSPYDVVIAVLDGVNAPVPVAFTWTVTVDGGNVPPAVTSPGDQASEEGAVVSLAVVGTDADEDVLTWSATGLPADLSIDAATGVISGTVAVGAEDGSPYAVAVTADDGTDTTTVNFTWTVGEVVNQPPVVSSPGDQQSVEGDDVSLQLTASDPDDDSLLYFVEVLPPGLTLGQTTGLISGTIADTGAEGSPYLVVVAVIDGNNPAVPISFNWAVTEPGANVPPAVTSPGDQQSAENDVVSVPVIGTDADEDVLTWSATGLPADLSIDAATGVISGTVAVGAEDGSPYAVAVTADDGTDTTTVNFTWTVGDATNQPPFLLNPGPQVAVDGDIVEGVQLTGNDPEGLPLTWSAAGLPLNLVIDTATGVISGTLADNASDNSPYQVVATASDGALSTNAVFEWIVTDGTVPNTIITGTITDANGVPFIPAEVDQYTVAADGTRGEFILSRANVPNGTYTIFTEPGCYFMTFIAPDGQTYNGGSLFTPPSFCVEVGQTATVDAQLDPIDNVDTTIGGTVTSTDGGAADVAVDLFQANTDGSRGAYLDSTTTGADGTYSFDVVPGCFVVTFIAPAGETFNGQGFFNSSGCVDAGQTNNTLDAAFDGVVVDDTAIGGTVTSGDGTPAANVGVDLFEQAADGSRGTWLESTSTGTDGVYSFGTDAGDYVVTFIAPAGETFNGEGFLSLPQSVADGQVITNLDAALDGAPEASIGGTVTDANGDPAPGVGADLFEANADGSRGAYLRSDVTDADGIYVLPATGGCFIVTLIATAGDTFNDSQFLSLPQCIDAGENFTGLDAQFDGAVSGDIVVSIGNGATREGDIGELRGGILPVTLSEASAVTETVTVTSSDDSAIAGEDYVAFSTVVTFEPGEIEQSVAFQVIGDEVFEEVDGADERFDAFLSAPSAGLVIGDGAGFARIIEDDEPGSDLVAVSIADAAITEADVNAPVTVTISLSAVSDTDVSVDVATADGTAVVVDDYMANSETVTILAGDLTADFAVMVVGDDVEEATEEFSVELSNPVGATIEDGTATVVVTDDDEAVVVLPELSIADASATETDADAPVTVTVSLSAASDSDVLVDLASADGTAVDVEDYVGVATTVTIPAGDLSATADVVIVGDDVEEVEEAFTLTLSNPVGATIADDTATVTIADDDEPLSTEVQISVSDVTVTELNDGLRNAVVTFSLDRAHDQTVIVQYTTVDGTATIADNDYLALAGEVRFPPGATSRVRAIKTVGDGVVEPDETLTVELSDPVNGEIADGVGVITILNND